MGNRIKWLASSEENVQEQAQTAADRERQLLAQLRRGNSAAVAELLQRYQDRLFTVMLRMTGNVDDAAELVQETFVRALGNLGRFHGNSTLYTWMFRIALNLALSHQRTKARRGVVSLNAMSDPLDGQAAGLRREFAQHTESNPADIAAIRIDQQALLDAIGRLDPDLRAILVLRDIEEASYDEISDVLDIPDGTVKSRLFRARVALRHALSPGKRSVNQL